MEIISHRGACFDAPENSLEAFELAIAQGADRIEFDVQVTRDGHPIVVHDERTRRTADGDLEVEFSPLAALRELRLSNGEPIPTLDEACALMAGRVQVDIELKATSDRVAFAVLECLQRHNMMEGALITSFDAQVLRRVRTMGYRERLGLLIGSKSMSMRQRTYEAWPLRGMELARADALVLHHKLIHGPLVRALKARRHHLYLWTTVEDEEKEPELRARMYRRLHRLPVDGVILARIPEYIATVAPSPTG
jgi:glycerophosphoryl diester phosphodiesterase